MPDFEDLRMADAIQKFRRKLVDAIDQRSAAAFKTLSPDLQAVYNFYVSSTNSFAKQEEMLKGLFSSFNYAAVLINNGIKQGKMEEEDLSLLEECFQVMLGSCDRLIASLQVSE